MPRLSRSDETIISPSTSKGVSLKTTIPRFIVNTLGLKKSDKLRWKLDGDEMKVKKGE